MEGCLYLLLTSYYQLRSRFEEGSWRGGLLERVKTLSCCAPDWEACKRGGRGGGTGFGGESGGVGGGRRRARATCTLAVE